MLFTLIRLREYRKLFKSEKKVEILGHVERVVEFWSRSSAPRASSYQSPVLRSRQPAEAGRAGPRAPHHPPAAVVSGVERVRRRRRRLRRPRLVRRAAGLHEPAGEPALLQGGLNWPGRGAGKKPLPPSCRPDGAVRYIYMYATV